MTVCTWYTSERAAWMPIGRPTQETGTRGTFRKCFSIDTLRKCFSIDTEQTSQSILVTVAAGSLKECIAEFRRKAEDLGIPAEKWDRFDIPLTENATRAVLAWAEAVRRTIKKSRKQAPADSSGTF